MVTYTTTLQPFDSIARLYDFSLRFPLLIFLLSFIYPYYFFILAKQINPASFLPLFYITFRSFFPLPSLLHTRFFPFILLLPWPKTSNPYPFFCCTLFPSSFLFLLFFLLYLYKFFSISFITSGTFFFLTISAKLPALHYSSSSIISLV